MRLLVLGGSVFLGHAFVARALEDGYQVTTFNRGRSGVDVPGVEVVRGDRESGEDLRRLVDGRYWDAVVDTSGFVPRTVLRAARVLSGHAGAYLFVSSVHACAEWPTGPVDEESPLHECPPDAGDDDGVLYNALKAGCERAVREGFDGKVLIVSPGLITGPRENVPRLTWWLLRVARGGKVLAPGGPGRELSLIDARDIAAFGLARLAAGAAGRYLVSGPADTTTFGRLLRECADVTGSDAEFVWADDAFLAGQGVKQWTELPMWAPDTPDFAGIWHASADRAVEAGLQCRPVADTVRATWEHLEDGPTPGQGIAAEKEQRILTLWQESATP